MPIKSKHVAATGAAIAVGALVLSSLIAPKPPVTTITIAFNAGVGYSTNRVWVQAATNALGPYTNETSYPMNGQEVTQNFSSTSKLLFFRLAWVSNSVVQPR